MEFKDQFIQEMVDILSLDVSDTRERLCEIKFLALKCIGYMTQVNYIFMENNQIISNDIRGLANLTQDTAAVLQYDKNLCVSVNDFLTDNQIVALIIS